MQAALVELLPSSAGLADDDKLSEESGSEQPSDQWWNCLPCCRFSPPLVSLSILSQHLLPSWESWCCLFSPAICSLSFSNPLSLSSCLSFMLMHSSNYPPLPHVSALLAHRCRALSTQTEGSCVAKGRGSVCFVVFILHCLPLLFCCGAPPVTLILKVICRCLCKGWAAHAHRSLVCFLFFHLAKSLLFFRAFLCFVLTSCSVLNGTQLRISSFIQINCWHNILLIRRTKALYSVSFVWL